MILPGHNFSAKDLLQQFEQLLRTRRFICARRSWEPGCSCNRQLSGSEQAIKSDVHHPAGSLMGSEEYEVLGKLTIFSPRNAHAHTYLSQAEDDDTPAPAIQGGPITHGANSIGFVKSVPLDNDDVFRPVSQGVPLIHRSVADGFQCMIPRRSRPSPPS